MEAALELYETMTLRRLYSLPCHDVIAINDFGGPQLQSATMGLS